MPPPRNPLPQAKRRQVAAPISIPAPTKGWVTAKALSDMAPDEAVLLDNFFPDVDMVRPRRGSKLYATGMGANPIETLFSFVSGANQRLFAASGPTIFEITNPATPYPLVVGSASARWTAINFGTAGSPYLMLVNGVDLPVVFNGTAFANPAFTLSGSAFSGAAFTCGVGYNQRLYLAAAQTIYYLPTLSHQGALSTLQVGPELARGGNIVALARYTHDAGNGPQDGLVAISDQGEAVMYVGTDPSAAGSWQLVAKYDIAPVLGGSRCVVKLGADLGILGKDGVQSMAKATHLDRADADNQGAFTAAIRNTIKDAAEAYGPNFGWQVHEHRDRSMLIVNVPIASGTLAMQYVMNVQTGAWARWFELPAVCWHTFGGNLLFGTANGTVIQADVPVYGDLGQPTPCTLIGSFQAVGGRGRIKQGKMIRALVTSRTPVPISIGVSWDYYLALTSNPVNGMSLGNSRFSRSLYGTSSQSWASATGQGFCCAPALFVSLGPSTNPGADLRINGFDLLLEQGGNL